MAGLCRSGRKGGALLTVTILKRGCGKPRWAMCRLDYYAAVSPARTVFCLGAICPEAGRLSKGQGQVDGRMDGPCHDLACRAGCRPRCPCTAAGVCCVRPLLRPAPTRRAARAKGDPCACSGRLETPGSKAVAESMRQPAIIVSRGTRHAAGYDGMPGHPDGGDVGAGGGVQDLFQNDRT